MVLGRIVPGAAPAFLIELMRFIPEVRSWERKNSLGQTWVMLLNEGLQGVRRQRDGVKPGKFVALEGAAQSQHLAPPRSLSLLLT